MSSLSQWCEQHGTFTGVAPLYIAITESACELRNILNATFPPPPAESAAADCTETSPVLAAVQKARESARVAECDLRLALQACQGKGAEFMVLHAIVPEATRVFHKLAELAGQLEDSTR